MKSKGMDTEEIFNHLMINLGLNDDEIDGVKGFSFHSKNIIPTITKVVSIQKNLMTVLFSLGGAAEGDVFIGLRKARGLLHKVVDERFMAAMDGLADGSLVIKKELGEKNEHT